MKQLQPMIMDLAIVSSPEFARAFLSGFPITHALQIEVDCSKGCIPKSQKTLIRNKVSQLSDLKEDSIIHIKVICRSALESIFVEPTDRMNKRIAIAGLLIPLLSVCKYRMVITIS